MYLPKKHYTIDEASHLLGVSKDTLRRWEDKGTLIPHRTRGGHRRYDITQLQSLMPSPVNKSVPNTNSVVYPSEQVEMVNPFDPSTLYTDLPKNRKKILTTSISVFSILLALVVSSKTILKDQYAYLSNTVFNTSASYSTNKQTKKSSVLAATALENPTFGINVDTVFRAGVNILQGITTPTINVTDTATINTANITGDTSVGGNLDLTGDLTIGGDIASTSDTINLFNTNVTTINIGGDATELNIGSDGATTTVTGNLVVTGTSNLQGAVTADSTLAVSGDSTLSGAITGGNSLTLAGLLDVNGTGINDIAGTLNLSGNTLSSTEDLLILPTGGGVSIGTGTAGDIDLADGDLYITDDLEVDGVIYGTFSGSVSTGFTQGSVVFIDAAGGLDEDNANFFWDDTLNRLGIGGTTTPQYTLDIAGTLRSSGATVLGSTLNVSGNTIISGTLNVIQTTTLGDTLEVTGAAIFNSTGDFSGALNLSSNSLTSSGDLVISAAGGGTKIGNGTPVSANMAGDDLYVTGDFEVGGTIYGGLSGTVTTSFSQGSIVFINGGGNLAEDNTNFFWDDTNNRLSLGTNTGATTTLYVSGTSLVTGTSTFNGNMVLGDATSDTITISSRFAGNLIPTTASTYDLGDATRTWETLYVDNIIASNISTTASDLNGTTANAFTINTDNATVDTESSSLVFDRGSASVNAELKYDATTGRKWLATNTTTFAINPLSETGITYSGKAALLVNQVQNQDLITASASGSTRFKVDVNGAITASGIGRVIIVDGNKYARTCAGINAAIDALGSVGGEVFLPEGTYTCTETITIDFNNTTIRGAGKGSIISATGLTSGDVIATTSKDYITLKDFKIIGSAGGTAGGAISSFGTDYSLYENLYIQNSDSFGIFFQSATHNKVVNCYIENSDSYGLYVFASAHYNEFLNNTLVSNQVSIFTDRGQYNKYIGNQSRTSDFGGMSIEAAHYNTIQGNSFDTEGGTAISLGGGGSTGVVIDGNNMIAPNGAGISTGGNSSFLIISNNYIQALGTQASAGILLPTSGGTVIGNTVTGFTNNVSTGHMGIRVTGNSNFISNNNLGSNTIDISDTGSNNTIINSDSGNTVIGGADDTPDTTLEITKASGSDSTFSMTDGDVAHGLTTLTDTDAFLKIAPLSSTAGGAQFTAISDTDAQALNIKGVIGSTNPTDTTAAIKLIGAKSNGTTGAADLAAAETVFAIANNDDADALYITGDGNVNTPRLNKTIVIDGITYPKTCAGINSAIDALPSTGGEIYLPEGTYTCTSTITIDVNNTTIKGAGKGSKIVTSAWASWSVPGHVFDLNGKDHLVFRDFQVDASANNAGGNAYDIFNGTGITYSIFDSLYLKGGDRNGIFMNTGGSYNKFTNTTYDTFSDTGGEPLNLFQESYSVVSSNIFKDGYDGIYTTSSTFLTITGNSILNSSSNIGIYFDGGNSHVVTGNNIYNCRVGIAMGSGPTKITMTGNTITFSGDAGIFTGGSKHVVTGNVIRDNDGAGDYGLYIWSNTSTYSGNTVSDHSGAGDIGINVVSGATDNVISGNQLENNTSDITDAGTNTAIINSEDGNTVLGGADSTPDTTLEIFRASGSDSTFSMTDGDVAHGLTTLVNTDAFFHLGALSSTAGGTQLTAISDTDAQALNIKGVIGSTDPTDTTAAVKIVGGKSNGTTGIADLGAAETVFAVANNDDANALTVYGDGSLVVGNPTGGAKGVGTINAVAVYDDNVLLTDYVFDKYFDGTVRPQDMDTHSNYNMLSIDEMGAFVANNRHLPTIAGRDEWIASGKFSLGALVTDIWETTETNSLYILELNNKLKTVTGETTEDTTSLVADIQDLRNSLENTNTKVNEQESKISQLTADIQILKDQTLLASSSATVAGTATESGQISTVDGITTLGDTVVTGKLNVGLLTLDSLNNSLDGIGNLKIQALQLGDIELMGNLIQIDTKGNINIKQGQIIGNSSFRGSEVLKAGDNQLRVDRAWESSPASITTTPGFNTNVWITEKTKDGFTINFEKTPLEDTTVDWLAIW